MLEVKFYEEVPDEKLKFAVILAKTQGKWVFCKHKERLTYEFPGGHREPGEDILDTAKRELYEETGALRFDITPIAVYSVVRYGEDTNNLNNKVEGDESFGMFFFATIEEFEGELHNEIESLLITEDVPANWTYPLIQPKLLEYAQTAGMAGSMNYK